MTENKRHWWFTKAEETELDTTEVTTAPEPERRARITTDIFGGIGEYDVPIIDPGNRR